jgi:GTP-binding protein of the ras superfamily involved in termination of M-phase
MSDPKTTTDTTSTSTTTDSKTTTTSTSATALSSDDKASQDDKDFDEKDTPNESQLTKLNLSLLQSDSKKKRVTVKVGMVGDSQIGKTSLMVKYVEGKFQEDYIETLGVNFMEKTIPLKNTDITFSIWDLGGQQEYLHMLPLVCNDAVALLFMFDLSRKSTLTSVKNWYKQARLLNKNATPFLIGTKYDYFATMKQEEKADITKQALRFSKAMKAPLIFCSASHSINIKTIFKIIVSKVFDLKCDVKKIDTVGDPIIEYYS